MEALVVEQLLVLAELDAVDIDVAVVVHHAEDVEQRDEELDVLKENLEFRLLDVLRAVRLVREIQRLLPCIAHRPGYVEGLINSQ